MKKLAEKFADIKISRTFAYEINNIAGWSRGSSLGS